MATQFADTGAAELPSTETEVQTTDNVAPESFYDKQEEVEPSDEELGEIEAGDEAPEPIAPPTSWSAEDRSDWDQIPRKQQEVIARREAERDRHLTTKAREASEAERRVRGEAEIQLAQIHRNSAAEIERFASLILPQAPDQRLLFTGNPQDGLTYQQQNAIYQQALAQQQQLQQQAQQRTAEAQRIEEQQALAQRQADAATLQQALPDWFDADKGPKLQAELQSIGSTLGYPVELMAEATAGDILALKKAAEWKAKADKFDAWMSRKMSAVAKAKQLPKIARPGAGGGQQQAPGDIIATLYPNDVRKN